MRKYFFYICLIFFMNASCVEDEPDIFGDILVRLEFANPQQPQREIIFGAFPTETLITKEFTPANAIKTATMREGQAIITDLIPGVYVVAALSSSSETIRQTTQVIADEVTLVDFDFRSPYQTFHQ